MCIRDRPIHVKYRRYSGWSRPKYDSIRAISASVSRIWLPSCAMRFRTGLPGTRFAMAKRSILMKIIRGTTWASRRMMYRVINTSSLSGSWHHPRRCDASGPWTVLLPPGPAEMSHERLPGDVGPREVVFVTLLEQRPPEPAGDVQRHLGRSWSVGVPIPRSTSPRHCCLLYTSDAADDLTRVDLGG